MDASGEHVRFKCSNCPTECSTKYNLKRHMEAFHGVLRCYKWDLPCPVAGCTVSATQMSVLTAHISEEHVDLHDSVCKHFADYSEFLKWKVAEEAKNICRFSASSGSKTVTGGIKRQHLHCHRSGTYVSKSKDKRHLKMLLAVFQLTNDSLEKIQGSCKTGSVCPANMVVDILPSGSVSVTYQAVHVGHSAELKFITLTDDERRNIASQLSQQIPFHIVLDNIRNNVDASSVSRLHLVNRYDLRNISHEFGLQISSRMHADDATSVRIWIEKCRAAAVSDGRCEEDSYVRFAKFQNEDSDMDGVRDDDFFLVIMTDVQVTMMKMFGIKKTVCVDSTHGTNQYDFQLTTLMVIDDHGEGFPVSFCYSNRVDQMAMEVFFHVVKKAVGVEVNEVTLMTDDAEAYVNAWRSVFGEPKHRLLCAWHVDRAWRQNLCKVNDSLLKATLYKNLRVLLEQPSVDTFTEQMKLFLEACNEDTKTIAFGKYFCENYADRPQVWAYCHRLGLHSHHNMNLEAMHRVLKHVYLEGRKCRRMDKSIHAVMAMLRDKSFDRLIKICKGKANSHVNGIRNRHKRAVATKPVVVKEDTFWLVKGSEMYTVRKVEPVPHPPTSCPLACDVCAVCIHSFTCNCVDFGLHNTICKHIHAVKLCAESHELSAAADIDHAADNELRGDTGLPDLQEPFEESPELEDEEACHLRSLKARKTIAALGQSIRNQLHCLMTTVDELEKSDNESALRSISESIDKCINTATALTSDRNSASAFNDMQIVEQQGAANEQHHVEPWNKQIEKQPRFFSTKRSLKRKRPEIQLTKPTPAEREKITAALRGEVEIVSRDMSSDDHSYLPCSSQLHFEHSYS